MFGFLNYPMNQTGQFHIGIDIGGTFTDFSLSDRKQKQLYVHKQLSTPDNPLAIGA